MNLENAPSNVCQCVECLRNFPASEVMPFADGAVCAECKPSAVAKLSAGMPLGWFWRKGRTLLVARTPEPKPFPRRCIACNADATGVEGIDVPVLNVIQQHEWKYYLCEKHLRIRRRKLWAFWLLLVASFVMFGIGANVEQAPFFVASAGLFIASLFAAGWPPHKMRPLDYHTEQHWRFQHCGRAFLKGLPEWPGKR